MNQSIDPFIFFLILSLFGVIATTFAEQRWFSDSGNALAAARVQSSQYLQSHIERQRLETVRR